MLIGYVSQRVFFPTWKNVRVLQQHQYSFVATKSTGKTSITVRTSRSLPLGIDTSYPSTCHTPVLESSSPSLFPNPTMKVASGTNSSSLTNRPVVAKRAFSTKSKLGHNRNAEFQRTLAPSTMTNTPATAATAAVGSTSSSSNMATFAMSSKSSLTKRITQSSFNNSQPKGECATAMAAPSDPPPGPNPLRPTETLMEDSRHDQTSSSAPPSSPMITSVRSVWYLGGNQLAKLLSSVDGDLDPILLATIAEVPSAIGDLALSVESLVSDDLFTVGGFETDLLARIASNTLAAKQQHIIMTAHQPVSPTLPSPSQAAKPCTTTPTTLSPKTKKEFRTLTLADPVPPTATSSVHVDSSTATTSTATTTTTSTSVPNPLVYYDPVPNPLARITPPASPLPTSVSTSAATTPTSSSTTGR